MDSINQLNIFLLQRNNNNNQMFGVSSLKLRNILIINLSLIILSSFSLYLFHLKKKNLLLSKNFSSIADDEYIIGNNFTSENIDSTINYFKIENNSLNKSKYKINNKYFKSFITPNFYQITKERFLYEKQKQSILIPLFNNKFEGKWEVYKNNNNKNSTFQIGNAKKGFTTLEFEKVFELRRRGDAIELVVKNNEGDYIDHWEKLTSYSKYENLYKKVDIIKNTFEINGKFTSKYEKGKIFDTTYKRKNRCLTSINMTFPLAFKDLNATLITGEEVTIGKIATINPENFKLFIDSSCGFQINIEAKRINEEKDKELKESQLKIFFYLSLFSALLYIFGVITVICGIRKTEMAVSALNIESMVLISIWNLYGFSSCMYLAFKYFDYFLSFFLIGMISLVKFIIFDSLIFFIYWRIKDTNITNYCQLAKLKIRFYVFLFMLFILSFFVITTLYINYFWIIFICLFLWIPQIIHNICTNNRYGLPFIYIFACTFDRIIYPFYFRCFKNNFFMINSNNNFFIMIIILEVFLILILLAQTFRGPRFMLTQKFQEFPYGFYKNREELQNINKDINNEECVICLMPIFSEEKNLTQIEMEDKNTSLEEDEEESGPDKINNSEDLNQSQNSTEIEKENISDINIDVRENKIERSLLKNEEESDINDDNNLLIKEENVNEKINSKIESNKKEEEVFNMSQNEIFFKKEYCIKKLLIFTSYIYKICEIIKIFIKGNILYFYKSSSNIKNKLYMLTPCKHIFHSECLEKWLEQKKECPNCRTSFENLI